MPGINSASELSPLARWAGRRGRSAFGVLSSPMLAVCPYRLAGKVFGHRTAMTCQ